MQRKLTSILSIDVVGYSRLMERDEGGTLSRLKQIRSEVISPSIERHAGRVIKLMGDGALMEFSSIVDALSRAIELQSCMGTRNAELPDAKRLQFRAGLHLGDVIVDGEDIYGDGVNVAARLEALAPPDGIVLSKQVFGHINGSVPVSFIALGEQSVKNISRPIEAFKVDLEIPEATSVAMEFGDFVIDTDLFELRRGGEKTPMEPQAFDLLVLLAKNAGRIVTKNEIFAEIWENRIVSDSALSSQVKAVRRAVGDTGSSQSIVATVHGRGFRFIAELKNKAAIEVSAASDAGDDSVVPNLIGARPSVTVLPFKNMNADSSEDYLADGIT